MLPQGECLVRTFCQQLGTSVRWNTTLQCVAAAIVGIALLTVLLEIGIRNQLAKEAADAAAGAIPAPLTSLEQTKFEDMFPILPTSPTFLESVEQLGAPGAPSSDDAQTFGQVSREPVPLPRPRKRR